MLSARCLKIFDIGMYYGIDIRVRFTDLCELAALYQFILAFQCADYEGGSKNLLTEDRLSCN